jgi:hypothetical protein
MFYNLHKSNQTLFMSTITKTQNFQFYQKELTYLSNHQSISVHAMSSGHTDNTEPEQERMVEPVLPEITSLSFNPPKHPCACRELWTYRQ